MSWTANPRRWQALGLVLVLGVLIWLLAPILTPFVISALLGWLGDPMVDRLERSGRSRSMSVGLVFGMITLALAIAVLVLAPMLWEQLVHLTESLPRIAQWMTNDAVPWLEHRLRIPIARYVDPNYMMEYLQSHWREAGGVATYLLGHLGSSGLVLFAIVTNIALVPVLTFYFLRDWDIMVAQVRDLLPRPYLPTVTRLARESDAVLGSFLRGQFSVMISLGTIYAVGLWAIGLDLGPLIGFVAGMVSFVPYLGAFVGVSSAILATLVQHGDLLHVGLVLTVFAVGQTMEGFVLVPWLVGDRIGLHPVAVIFAIMAGGKLFGFLGVLLALPVAAVSMVLLRHAHDHYRRSGVYGAEANADPEAVSEELEVEGEDEGEREGGRELPPPADVSASEDPPAPYPEP
jgi:predicted PurR-regulated permease PerM